MFSTLDSKIHYLSSVLNISIVLYCCCYSGSGSTWQLLRIAKQIFTCKQPLLFYTHYRYCAILLKRNKGGLLAYSICKTVSELWLHHESLLLRIGRLISPKTNK